MPGWQRKQNYIGFALSYLDNAALRKLIALQYNSQILQFGVLKNLINT
ncbi:hypothetical protein JCM16408A_58450 [Methylobacterium phyllosphaerae]